MSSMSSPCRNQIRDWATLIDVFGIFFGTRLRLTNDSRSIRVLEPDRLLPRRKARRAGSSGFGSFPEVLGRNDS